MRQTDVMFVSSIDLTGEVVLDILKGDGEYIVRVPIGYDDVEGTIFSAVVALSPLIGYADMPGFELVFNLVAASDGGDIRAYWDGAETRNLLCEPRLRAQVRQLIMMMIGVLVDEAKPALVQMTTHQSGLPDKALTKYTEVCAIFKYKGFKAGKADIWHGQHIWMMER